MNHRYLAFGLAGVLVLCLFTACQKKNEPAPVLLRIGSHTVALEEFRRNFERTLPTEHKLTDEEREELQRSYLIQRIDRHLGLAEAARLGIRVSPAEVDAALEEHRRDYPGSAFEEMLGEQGITLEQWRRELEEGLTLEKVVKEAVYAGIRVEEEEVEAHFQESQEDFERPAQVRARQIVVANEADGQRVLGLLRQGEPFAEVAKENSLSPDADEGGDLGFFSRGDMPPEFDKVVFTIPVGRLSDLVKSDYGYHIFLVEERRSAKRLTLAAVREEIISRLRGEKEEEAYQQWLQELRGRATIEVDWSLL